MSIFECFFKTKLVFFYGFGQDCSEKLLWWEGGVGLPMCDVPTHTAKKGYNNSRGRCLRV